MGLFADLIQKQEITPAEIPQELPPIADPNDVGLFGDLIGKPAQQPNLMDRFFLKLDKTVLAAEQGYNQAGMNLVSGLAGTGQFVGELGEKWGDILKSKKLRKWSQDLTEVSKIHGQALDIYQQEHPEEAMQISPDAGFWQTTKEVVTSPENMTKGIVQAIPMMLEAYLGHIAGGVIAKGASAGPRTIAAAQKFGRIAGIASGLFGNVYREARKKNVSPEAATAQAFLTSFGEAAIEEWTLGKKIGLFKSAKAALIKGNLSKLASTILIGGGKAYVRGAAEEATQQLNENFWNFVFADRSQDLMKGVAQAGAIGGPLEMAMAGMFASAGLVSRQISKVDQLNRLDKIDDFIENSDLKDEQKKEAHQVIDNKRAEIEQTSILPTEGAEKDVETPVEQLQQLNEEEKNLEKDGLTPDEVDRKRYIGDIRTKTTKEIVSKVPGKIVDQESLTEVGNAILKELGLEDSGIKFVWSNRRGKIAFYRPRENTVYFCSKNDYVDLEDQNLGLSKQADGSYTPNSQKFIDKQMGGVNDLKALIIHEISHSIVKPYFTGKYQRRVVHGKEFKAKVKEFAWKVFEEQTKVIPDETITPEMMPEVHPDQEVADVKEQNSVESTIDKLIGLVETYKEPLVELGEERKEELGKRFSEAQAIYESGKEPELLFIALKKLEGELPHLKYRNLAVEFTPEQIKELIWQIRSTPKFRKVAQKMDTERGLLRLLNGQEIRPFEVQNLIEVFGEKGEQLAKALRSREELGLAWYQRIADVINIPIATLTAYDLSAILRQGFLLGLTAPKAWAEHVKTGYSILFSEDFKKQAEKIDFAIKTNEYYDFVKDKMGVEFTNWRSVAIEGSETQEERYRSELAHKIPFVSRSEAAYVLGLNKMRLDAAIQFLKEWKGTNKTDTDYKMLGKFINLSTGRGDVKALKSVLPMLNGAFFAPRFFASKFQLPIHLIRTMIKSPAVFKIMARQLVSFIGVGALVLGLASMIPGVSVDTDPESSDFLKIRYGNTRISFFQGYEQIVRTVIQLITKHRKSTVTGRRLSTERKDIIWRFLQSKLSPVAGAVNEMFVGKKFDGSPVEYTAIEIGKTFLEKTVPLFFQDVVDAWRFGGFDNVLAVAPAAFHGLNVQTYPVRPEQQATLVKQELARSYFGKDWDQIGPLAQSLLREAEPEIEESEVMARIQREGYPYLDEIIKEQKVSEKRVYRKLPESVQDELDSTFSEIGGLSRRIGNGWFLNDKRYTDYVNNISKYLNKALPLIVNAPKYKLLTNEQKKAVLERAIQEIKSAERKRLINEGKREDVETLRERIKK